MTFMRKVRVFEDRVGEIRVKGDLGQALHSENIFFLSSSTTKVVHKERPDPDFS